MNVLIFSPYYPPHIGGLESHSEEFNQQLAQRGIDVLVFTPRLPKDAPERETRRGVRIIRFPAFEIIPNFPLPQFFPFFWTPDVYKRQRQGVQSQIRVQYAQGEFPEASHRQARGGMKQKIEFSK